MARVVQAEAVKMLLAVLVVVVVGLVVERVSHIRQDYRAQSLLNGRLRHLERMVDGAIEELYDHGDELERLETVIADRP